MRSWLKYVLGFILTLGTASDVSASHFYGADLFYTYVSGTTYTVTFVAYGDCGGSSFPAFPGATPEVDIFDKGSWVQTITLDAQAPFNGVEVTPVCPSQLSNTNCVSSSGTIPGVKKFVYSLDVDLGDTSSNWLFRFNGTMGTASLAGRSGSITNITGSASTMMLEATLNNTADTNSSPTYTTIPTPFFCINRSANYNPGTVDPDIDSLAYELVPGLDGASTTGFVTYATGFSAIAPLAVTSGTFSFSGTTGQLAFRPNLVQRALVVYKVSEYRNGRLIGTSMREMTFVVLSSCSNNPPIGKISGVTGGTLKDSVTVNVCQAVGTLGFNINPTDADGNTINVVYSGIPAGASFNVTANNTTTPLGAFSWNVNAVTPGAYTFFVTYTDNGCPLSSRQTQAYTVNVFANPTIAFSLVSPATCTKKAVFTVTSSVNGPWKVKFYQGSSPVDSISSSSSTVTDSLVPGTYTMRTYNANNCFKDTLVTLVSPSKTQIAATVKQPTCNAFSNGAISITASNSIAPYTYAINTGAYTSISSFSGIPAGSYIIHVKDSTLCIKDTTIVLTDSIKVKETFALTHILCNSSNTGIITVTASGGIGAPYTYSINSAPAVASNSFTGLLAGAHKIRAQDGLGCFVDSTVTLTQPTTLSLSHTVTDAKCFGSSDGSITETAIGGVPPYTFNINGGAFSANPTFNSLKAGNYTLSVKDKNDCIKSATITISEPTGMKIESLARVHPLCSGDASGSFTINVSGGTAPYMYGVNSQPMVSSSTISGLVAGGYIIHVTDANGCKKDTVAGLTQPSAVVANYTITHPKCKTLANGSIKITAGGGIKPYTYSLDSSAYTSKTVYGPLTAGVYTVNVKDSNGCIKTAILTLKDSLFVYSNVAIQDASCFGLADGGFTVTPAGGVSPYKVAIENKNYRDTFIYKGLAAQEYKLYVKDSFGCIGDTIIKVDQPDKIVLTPEITYNNCYGLDTVGKIILKITGGTEPYEYRWSNDTTAKRNGITGLSNGVYKVWVTDAHSCDDSLVAEVTYDDCCTPFIPTAFTPNGDGKNDDFKVLAKGDMKLIQFSVYNRFGQCMFTTDQFGKGWDGKWKGTPQDLGTYYYYLKAICGNSGEHTVMLKGDVTLIK